MFEEQQLDPSRHSRKAFCSGVPALDRFLQQHAHQNMRSGVNQTFVLVPCFRLGRLARDQPHLDAKRAIGGYALIVDAKGSEAVAFYERHGFLHFQDTPRSLYLPLGD